MAAAEHEQNRDDSVSARSPWRSRCVAVVLSITLLWAYGPTLLSLVQRWASDPQASHGFLVPVFALLLLWQRRERMPVWDRGFSWWGVVLLGAAGLLYLAGGYYLF